MKALIHMHVYILAAAIVLPVAAQDPIPPTDSANSIQSSTDSAQTNQSDGGDTKETGGVKPTRTEEPFHEKLMLAIIPAAITGLLGIGGIFLTYKMTTRDRSPKFKKLTTGNINIHNSSWTVVYRDNDEDGVERCGVINFEQYGNRLIGSGCVPKQNRKWTIEGVVSNRRLCYIYHGDDQTEVSFGTSMLDFNDAGDELTGVWNGWTPDGRQFKDLQVTLTKK